LDAGVNGLLVDSLLNYETVEACANEGFESRRIGGALQNRSVVALRNQGALSLLHIAQSGIIAAGVASIMLFAGKWVMQGRLSVG
ncbi:ABC transporter transmembrane domain-containing protein, partial [Staphylococcus aureus]